MSEPGFNPQPPTFEVIAWSLSQCRTNTDFLKNFSHKGLFFARTFLFIITLMGPLEMRDSYSNHLVSPPPWSVNICMWDFIFNIQNKCYNCKCEYKKTMHALVIILSDVFTLLYMWWTVEKSVYSSNETQSYIEVNEPPLYLHRPWLTLQLQWLKERQILTNLQMPFT